MADDTIINIDLTKLEKESALQTDLKIEELRIKLFELKHRYDMDKKTYNQFLKKLNSFRK